jgi:hypothetical protein
MAALVLMFGMLAAPAADASSAAESSEPQIAREEAVPVTGIQTFVTARPKRNPERPGFTTIEAETSPNAAYSWVVIELKRGPARRRVVASDVAEIVWPECDAADMGAGFTVTYTVRARPLAAATGWTAVKHGSIKVGSRTRCTWLNDRAARESDRRIAAERRQVEEEQREAREGRERFERNCRAIGGIPATIERADGEHTRICRAHGGGVLPVPE